MKNTTLFLFVLVYIFTITFSNGKITTPDGYYNLIKYNNYQQFPNRVPNKINKVSKDFYFPDICSNTIPNDPNYIFFNKFGFTGSNDTFNNLLITKDSNMILLPYNLTEDFINILCVEGTLEIKNERRSIPLSIGALVILPGGSVICGERSFVFRDLYEPSLIDPFNFFPGILSLGGSLSFSNSHKVIYNVKRIDDTVLSIPDLRWGFINPMNIYCYSESYPHGQLFSITSNLTHNNFVIINRGTIEETENNIVCYLQTKSCTSKISSTSSTGASIFITGNSNVTIDNFIFESLGKTTNQVYNDTVLIFDSNDSSIVTDIIVGKNQRFRASLYIENSNNVTIINSVFTESYQQQQPIPLPRPSPFDNLFDEQPNQFIVKETRSPIVISQSKVTIRGCLVSSRSGSNIIAQYGTELIESTNNVFYLSKTNRLNTIKTSSSYMDYGFEGNGIYSLSPFINSASDTFIGHSNAFNFNFIANRSSVIGFDKDCFAPCNISSKLVSSYSQFPIDFKLNRTNFIQSPWNESSSSPSFLLYINNNGSEATRYFTIGDLKIYNRIKVNLNDSVLILSNLNATYQFNIQGSVGKLEIINSNINPTVIDTKKNFLYNLYSNSTKVSNSYIRTNTVGEESDEFDGSPYHYDIENLNENLPIISTFPSEPLQVAVYQIVNIMVQLGNSTFNGDIINCEFRLINGTNDTFILAVPVSRDNNKCILQQNITIDGKTNLKVKIVGTISPSSIYYSLLFPTIYSFNNLSLNHGWKINSNTITPSPNNKTNNKLPDNSSGQLPDSSSQFTNDENNQFPDFGDDHHFVQDLLDTNLATDIFEKECTKQNGCEVLSNNIKIESSLPNLSNQYLPIGISTNNSFEPLTMNLGISEYKYNQIQLYFTYYQSIDTYSSPLSIYLNNESILILDAVSQQHFKKVIYFENISQLKTVQLSIVSRGDIYLTGAAVYSSFIAPVIIPSDLTFSPFSDNLNMKTIYILIFVGVTLFILSTVVIVFAFYKHNLKNIKRKLGIYSKSRMDQEIELETTKHQDTGGGTIPSSPSTMSLSLYNNNNNNSNYVGNYNNIKKNINDGHASTTISNGSGSSVLESPSSPRSHVSNRINYKGMVVDRYKINAEILMCTQESTFYEWDSDEFPISFSKQTLEFGCVDGKRCDIDVTLFDCVFATNKTGKIIELTIHLPTDNGAGYCTTDKTFLQIEPFQTIRINFAILIYCTSKWLEKFAIQVDGYGYTFLQMNLESALTCKLDYRELEFEELIGQSQQGGGTTTVYKGIWRSLVVAIKLIKVANVNSKEVYRQMRTMSKLVHPNCSQMFGYVFTPDNLCIVSQFATLGSLGDLIYNRKTGSGVKKLSLKQKVRFALDIATGCQFLHQHGIIHRHLKPNNILIVDLNYEAPVCVMVTDFGLIKHSKRISSNSDKASSTTIVEPTTAPTTTISNVQLPIYSSNEVLSKKQINNSSDVYSFGMSFYELMIEEIPYSDLENPLEFNTLVISGLRPTKGLDTLDKDISSLIVKCWAPKYRPTFDQIVIDLKLIVERLN